MLHLEKWSDSPGSQEGPHILGVLSGATLPWRILLNFLGASRNSHTLLKDSYFWGLWGPDFSKLLPKFWSTLLLYIVRQRCKGSAFCPQPQPLLRVFSWSPIFNVLQMCNYFSPTAACLVYFSPVLNRHQYSLTHLCSEWLFLGCFLFYP